MKKLTIKFKPKLKIELKKNPKNIRIVLKKDKKYGNTN